MSVSLGRVRAEMAAKRGGVIVIHRPECGLVHGDEHDCRQRIQVVRPR